MRHGDRAREVSFLASSAVASGSSSAAAMEREGEGEVERVVGLVDANDALEGELWLLVAAMPLRVRGNVRAPLSGAFVG